MSYAEARSCPVTGSTMEAENARVTTGARALAHAGRAPWAMRRKAPVTPNGEDPLRRP